LIENPGVKVFSLIYVIQQWQESRRKMNEEEEGEEQEQE